LENVKPSPKELRWHMSKELNKNVNPWTELCLQGIVTTTKDNNVCWIETVCGLQKF
jgi:hypothetical protein